MAQQQEGKSYNLDRALYMADSYMIMADTEQTQLDFLNKSDLKADKARHICLIISSLAFSLEIYFKSILYCIDGQASGGHDLKNDLWDKLPVEIKKWLSANFDNTYKHSGKGWRLLFILSHGLGRHSGQFETPDTSASGMIEGHKDAFTVARYGYEHPPSPKTKLIFHDKEGLYILTCLTRTMAHYFVKQVKAKESGSDNSQELKFPTGTFENFPPKSNPLAMKGEITRKYYQSYLITVHRNETEEKGKYHAFGRNLYGISAKVKDAISLPSYIYMETNQIS